MSNFVKISDYFKEDSFKSISKSDIRRVYAIRENINSFKYINEQYSYIKDRRSSNENIEFDFRVFHIPKDAYVSNDDILDSSDNEYYSNKEIKDEKNSNKLKKGFLYGPLIKASVIGALIFVFINVGVYIVGLYDSYGSTPFGFCSDGSTGISSINFDTAMKEKDGYKIPVDYMVAGEGYQGQNYDGPDENRGKGIFASEDFRLQGRKDDSLSREIYGAAARWEYAGYTIKKNMWPGHEHYGNGTSDGMSSIPGKWIDHAQHAWTKKQKVLVHNPENGKSVIATVGDGGNDANWGGSPLNSVAGLSYKAQEALGFSAGGLDGGDYKQNSRDSGVELEMWWVDESTPIGPVGGLQASSTGTSATTCSGGSSIGGGNASIADAAVSLAHESIAIAKPNTSANRGNGPDLYINIHDKVLPGDPWYQSCDRFVATAVRWAGADDNIPAGATDHQLIHFTDSDKWEYVKAKGEKDLLPGDILVKRGHIIVYVGNEAVRKKFPNSNGVLAHASIGYAGSPAQQQTDSSNRPGAVDTWYDMGLKEVVGAGGFYVFRNVKQEANSKYKDIRP